MENGPVGASERNNEPLTLWILKLLTKFTPCGITADNYAPTTCSCSLNPTTIITVFCNLEGMPRWLFKMIIVLGRKGWGHHQGRHAVTVLVGTL